MENNINITLPQGVKDILPEDAVKIAKARDKILQVFSASDFERISTPLIEYLDVLSLGMGDELKDRAVKFVDPVTGNVLAIRPDITPQVARMVATRLKDKKLPLKLSYSENVLRYESRKGGKINQLIQIGAEYVSQKAEPKFDAEMIILAIEALKKAGVKNFTIDIADVGFVRAVLNSLKVGQDVKKEIKNFLELKDTSGLTDFLNKKAKKIQADRKELLILLTTLYGEKEVIKKAKSVIKDKKLKDELNYLEKVVRLVMKKGLSDNITIDLGEVRGFDYYTGVTFEGFAKNVGKPVLSGGRYDNLVEKYGLKVASTGFAFDIENLVNAI